jgi:excisionase family DNA binding protein
VTRYLNYEAAAEYLSMPVGTLRAMVHGRRIPHIRLSARSVKFEISDLDAWMAARKQQVSP